MTTPHETLTNRKTKEVAPSLTSPKGSLFRKEKIPSDAQSIIDSERHLADETDKHRIWRPGPLEDQVPFAD